MSVHPREQLVYIAMLVFFAGMMMLLGIILMLGSIRAINANRSNATNLLGSVLFSVNIMIFSICTPLESEIIGRAFDGWVMKYSGLQNGSWLAFLTMCYTCNVLGPLGIRKMTGERYELHHFIKVTLFVVATFIVYMLFLSNQPSMVLHTLRPHTHHQALLVIITRFASFYTLNYNARIWDYAYQSEVVTNIKVRAMGWRIASIAARVAAVLHTIAVLSWSFFDQQLLVFEVLILINVLITLSGFIITFSPQPFFKKYMYTYHLKHWLPLSILDKKLRIHAPSIYDVQIDQRWKYHGLMTDINRMLIKIADIKREARESSEGVDLDPDLLAAFNAVDDTLPFSVLLSRYAQIANKFTWKHSKICRSIKRIRLIPIWQNDAC